MERVLQIGFSSNYGGIETFLMNYYRNIDRSKIQFDFINPYDHLAFEEEIVELGGRIISTGDFHYNPIGFYNSLRDICSEYSIVHVHMLSAANLLPLYAAKRSGVKRLIVHSHNTETEDIVRKSLHMINRRKINKLADVQLACSKEAGYWLFGNTEFKILNNAVDTSVYRFNKDIRNKVRKKWNVDSETVVVGHVGRLNMQKNHKFLIEVFNSFHKMIPNSKLVLVGIGELEESIKIQVTNLKLQKDVFFLGKRLDVNEIYNGFDIFVMPSLFEGLPVVLVEAETNGLQCLVSSNVPKDCCLTSTIKFLSLQESPEKWADKMVSLGVDRNIVAVEEIANAGFDVKLSAKTLENVYIIRNNN